MKMHIVRIFIKPNYWRKLFWMKTVINNQESPSSDVNFDCTYQRQTSTQSTGKNGQDNAGWATGWSVLGGGAPNPKTYIPSPPPIASAKTRDRSCQPHHLVGVVQRPTPQGPSPQTAFSLCHFATFSLRKRNEQTFGEQEAFKRWGKENQLH